MKKISLFLFVLLLSTQIFAATDTLKTSGKIQVWKESVVGDSKVLGQLGYVYGHTSTSDTLNGTTRALCSPIFGVGNGLAPSKARNAFSGTKFMVGLNVVVAYASVSATLIVEGSGDGVNWTTIYTASSNTAPATTGTTWYLVDLSTTYLPYYRLIWNKGGLTANQAGKLQFLYALPIVN